MTYYDFARDLHITFGTLALVAFWTTAALRKGTSTHKLTGRIYLLAILAVITTALPLAMHAFLAGQDVLGIFLAYLVLITGTAAWTAGGRFVVAHRMAPTSVACSDRWLGSTCWPESPSSA